MHGIKEPSDVTLEYCCKLMLEYSALDTAQMYGILKEYSGIKSKKLRKQMMRQMCQLQYARIIHLDGRNYFIRHKKTEIKGRVKAQVMCFWVLLKYLDRVDRHYASGTASSVISMEIAGRDYSIIYVEQGKELMCSYSMEKGGVTRYFVVVDDAAQIPLIKGDQIHAFVTVSADRKVQYFAAAKGE